MGSSLQAQQEKMPYFLKLKEKYWETIKTCVMWNYFTCLEVKLYLMFLFKIFTEFYIIFETIITIKYLLIKFTFSSFEI